jgi:hypothetical protein
MKHDEKCSHVLTESDKQFSWPIAQGYITEYKCPCGAKAFIKGVAQPNPTSAAVDRELIQVTNQLNRMSTILYGLHSEVCKAREDREAFIAGIRRKGTFDAQTSTHQSSL